MLLKPPGNCDIAHTTHIHKWSATYSIYVSTKMYPVTADVLYTLPGFEVVDIDILAQPELTEHHMFEYVHQMAAQTGLGEFFTYADSMKANPMAPMKQIEERIDDDPLFMEEIV